ncbi:MAG: hypothetical protein IPL67_10570 [Ignavibacteria bacterium]|nr:hypothetical protein [Ignavibacteria bacterium]
MLVSDVIVENNKILEIADFAITDTVEFRSMNSAVRSTRNYSALNAGNVKSSKRILFRRGSVFYGKSEEISDELKRNQEALKIGFNKFKIIQS